MPLGDGLPLLTLAVLTIALLYSSVGHAGASGYIAVMTLFGLAPIVIKPTALVLNILVASITSYQFWRAGHFSWYLFWPFALLAVPFAFVGGYINLPTHVFNAIVGLVLFASAARLLREPREEVEPHAPSKPVALGVGAGLGLLSGLTGTGGGIFLTPLVLLMRWAKTRTAAAISAMFILSNSLAGLAGNLAATQQLPPSVAPLAGAAIAGGLVGSHLGSRRLPQRTIKRLLAVTLTIAGFKLMFRG